MHAHTHACINTWSRTRNRTQVGEELEEGEEEDDGEVVLPSAHRLMLDWPAQPIAPRSRRGRRGRGWG